MGLASLCRSLGVYLAAIFPSSLLSYDSSLPQQALIPSSAETAGGHYPTFPPPKGPQTPEEFKCEYPELSKDWSYCSTPTNRECWLRHKNGSEFNIHTNYETTWPVGRVREYELEVSNMTLDADGIPNPGGKVFNGQYPGPWIKACWGDLIRVTVKNKLQFNGTTVHWHGFRQSGTVEMDGVNGVTQCPVAPNESFTYEFRATQYGTSWYHSHYSLQYADGLAGPITVFGPSSSPYDESKEPIIITDWNHRSAFEDWQKELTGYPDFPKMNSVLINGRGNFAGGFNRDKFQMTVTKDKKYLLRIINTSVDTTYIFTIDNHNFTVMSSDFVPITPYVTDHVVVGIGQRYHIVLDGIPIGNKDRGPISDDGNYWIRTIPAKGCAGFETGNTPDERQGLLRYNASSEGVPRSYRRNFSLDCRDEHYDDLKPIVPWNVTVFEITAKETQLDIGKMPHENRPEEKDNFFWWALGDHPLWLNFSDPTLLNLDTNAWPNDYVVLSKNGTAETWVYLVVTGPPKNLPGKPGRSFFPVAHPMHLHGHDFALLAQGTDFDDLSDSKNKVKLKFNNPPRRDVVLLPTGGYVVIAFKADNPGSWLFHCHIPWHASSGLALQILERQEDLREMLAADGGKKLEQTREGCRTWDKWFNDPKNHFNPKGPFQDDSGI